ncbi:2-polyprenyl-6-methoxyphenol hydroxylase-like FAD-dependent oxidoreductase [Actinoalloteichus hoggarensis]|uniref:Pentachlorophenol 4-monooxygenase n=2 Tax=Actinoalloteichus hoggarensis TaxID=1470176 RepID=A0A221W9K1_9PSEU|nr:FAD-dependent oxidoreductase [Actinoalloteichus hoggarensis]ASO22361.1 Pentachlorophenol 4-monooxygenase [Actinoalloteichus hoggarensis]MBB5923217.1 2-polyprenyl-6-methoxyphenol hydroxylase-like FAD-dependent oxidoreductase [Actinoalloteichus hoggarensis]
MPKTDDDRRDERTTCVVVGGGPAGLMLGLLLARAGVAVTVLEKHGDFLRDFRGDTVHPSTLTLLDELGLGERFAALPQRRVDGARVLLDQGVARVGDLRRVPGRYKHIALVPQWDFLDLIRDAAAEEPTFELRMRTEVVGVVQAGGRVRGVRYRDESGEGELRADLVVACDGRSSTVRRALGLRPREFGAPMDVLWFRLSRRDSDPEGLVARFRPGEGLILIDRGEYSQCGYLIPKGTDAALRERGVEDFRTRIARLLPILADRVAELSSFDDVSALRVRLDRLRRWHVPGLLCIGDAAHAMSPIGGVGINLAIQDAVAAARITVPGLLAGTLTSRDLARVGRRRIVPALLIQTAQRLVHRRLFRDLDLKSSPPVELGGRMPLPLRLIDRLPAVQAIPATLVGIGPLPEHAPAFARRPASSPDRRAPG